MHLVKFVDSENSVHYGIVDDGMIVCGCCGGRFCLEDGDEVKVLAHWWANMEEDIKEAMENA